jgi:hypothetical protein
VRVTANGFTEADVGTELAKTSVADTKLKVFRPEPSGARWRGKLYVEMARKMEEMHVDQTRGKRGGWAAGSTMINGR